MNQAITQALQEYKPIEANIQKSLPNTDDYVINGVWDENGYKATKSALRDAKQVRKQIEDKRKELKAIALEYGRAVDGEAKRLMEICEPTIAELESRIANVDMEREKIKQEKRHKRQQELTTAGFEFALGAYRVGTEIVHPSAVDDASEDDWAQILERGKAAKIKTDEERERVEAERKAAEDERRALEAERLKLQAEREELERLRKAAEDVQEEVQAPEVNQAAAIQIQHDTAPLPSEELEPYEAGFEACRSLAIEAIRRFKSRREMLDAVKNFRI